MPEHRFHITNLLITNKMIQILVNPTKPSDTTRATWCTQRYKNTHSRKNTGTPRRLTNDNGVLLFLLSPDRTECYCFYTVLLRESTVLYTRSTDEITSGSCDARLRTIMAVSLGKVSALQEKEIFVSAGSVQSRDSKQIPACLKCVRIFAL